MIINIILLILGFVLLIVGANSLVNGATMIAKKFGISELVIGFTVVAIGTSAPEIFISIAGSLNGNNDLILGNILGSNLFNLLFILGIGGIIANIKIKKRTIKYEIPLSIVAVFLVFILGNSYFNMDLFGKGISRVDGSIMLFFFFLYISYSVLMAKKDNIIVMQNKENIEKKYSKNFSKMKSLIYLLFGLVFLYFGGEFVVNNAISLAEIFGLSEKFIAITIIATGTSLPEFVTAMISIKKGKIDLVIGDLIGSCIINILLVLGISSVISPIQFSTDFNSEIGVIIGGSFILLLAMVTGRKYKLERWEAFIIFSLYVFFICSLFMLS